MLATERHESRRIDNQLRGRSGRQGDPGETRFYLSGEDDLVRLFAGDRIKEIMERFKLPDDQPMEAKILSHQIENAQKKVEEQNFVARKNVLKYDDVMNTQRMVIYEQRRRVLEGDDLSEDVRDWIREVVETNVAQRDRGRVQRGLGSRARSCSRCRRSTAPTSRSRSCAEEVELEREALIEEFVEDALETYDEKEQQYGPELMREIERYVILQVVDSRWRSHLDSMDYLRDGIHLRAMAQKDPLVEYRAEGHAMFKDLSNTIREEVVLTLFHAQVELDDGGAGQLDGLEPEGPNGNLQYAHETAAGSDAIAAAGAGASGGSVATAFSSQGGGSTATAAVNEHKDVGRNDPCWCGSGKKFKRCHGA